jgi:hypothetical protein
VQYWAHSLVKETAENMASAVFEESMSRDNSLFRQVRAAHPGKTTDQLRTIFVRRQAPYFVGEARATLAGMLELPLDPKLKETIFDALLKDAALRRGRGRLERRILSH